MLNPEKKHTSLIEDDVRFLPPLKGGLKGDDGNENIDKK
jgi:hypothetical protein